MENKKQELAVPEFEKLPAEVRANMLSSETSVYFNVALFEQVQRVATLFAKSTMIPERFRGNVGNCMIALNYAHRIKADEFMVFQNLYEVYGTPGISGKLVEAIINQSGKYSEPLDYEWLDPEDKIVPRREVLKAKVPSEYGCQAVSVDAKSGKRVIGPKITWELIKSRGWYDRKGLDGTIESNNWRTMAEMMFYYRAAAWFGNKNCPEKTLGMPTLEELQDIVDLKPRQNGSYGVPVNLQDKLKGKPQAEAKDDIYEAKETPESEKKVEEETEEEVPKEDPIRVAFINLKKPGFKPYVEANRKAIDMLPEKYQAEIKAKWDKFDYGEPFPGSESIEKVEEPEDVPPNSMNSYGEGMQSESETDHDKYLRLVDGAKETTSGPANDCPESDKQMLRTKCEGNCNSREGCPSFTQYDKE